jgi:protein SCO1/2
MNSINKNTIFVMVILILAFGIGVWRSKNPERPQQAGMIATHHKTLPSFDLTEVNSGKAFTPKELTHQWSFLFFGYSACPDVCPNTINTLNQLSTVLRHQPGVQYLFISINPEKDTPEKLAAFLGQAKFQPSVIKGVTGDKKQIMDLARTIGIFVDEHPSQPAISGPIEHSGTIVLMNPKGELAAVFMPSDTPADIAKSFQQIYQQSASLNRLKPAMPS